MHFHRLPEPQEQVQRAQVEEEVNKWFVKGWPLSGFQVQLKEELPSSTMWRVNYAKCIFFPKTAFEKSKKNLPVLLICHG